MQQRGGRAAQVRREERRRREKPSLLMLRALCEREALVLCVALTYPIVHAFARELVPHGSGLDSVTELLSTPAASVYAVGSARSCMRLCMQADLAAATRMLVLAHRNVHNARRHMSSSDIFLVDGNAEPMAFTRFSPAPPPALPPPPSVPPPSPPPRAPPSPPHPPPSAAQQRSGGRNRRGSATAPTAAAPHAGAAERRTSPPPSPSFSPPPSPSLSPQPSPSSTAALGMGTAAALPSATASVQPAADFEPGEEQQRTADPRAHAASRRRNRPRGGSAFKMRTDVPGSLARLHSAGHTEWTAVASDPWEEWKWPPQPQGASRRLRTPPSSLAFAPAPRVGLPAPSAATVGLLAQPGEGSDAQANEKHGMQNRRQGRRNAALARVRTGMVSWVHAEGIAEEARAGTLKAQHEQGGVHSASREGASWPSELLARQPSQLSYGRQAETPRAQPPSLTTRSVAQGCGALMAVATLTSVLALRAHRRRRGTLRLSSETGLPGAGNARESALVLRLM